MSKKKKKKVDCKICQLNAQFFSALHGKLCKRGGVARIVIAQCGEDGQGGEVHVSGGMSAADTLAVLEAMTAAVREHLAVEALEEAIPVPQRRGGEVH